MILHFNFIYFHLHLSIALVLLAAAASIKGACWLRVSVGPRGPKIVGVEISADLLFCISLKSFIGPFLIVLDRHTPVAWNIQTSPGLPPEAYSRPRR